MSIKPFNWQCPHCNHHVTITDELFSSQVHWTWQASAEGKIALRSQFVFCPNRDCKKATVAVVLSRWEPIMNGEKRFVGDALLDMRLVPLGESRPFPNYVPVPIREDYEEACQIRDLSPKSAATLARRALQGVLRDFYKVKPGRLVDEINALEETMDPELYEAIHGVRKVGNIGAHMEADINVIVDVEPGEAQVLIGLVETMIGETYERREQRKNRLAQVKALADAKDQARKQPNLPPQNITEEP